MKERDCPLCGNHYRRQLHIITLTFGGVQTIDYCTRCSMVYSSLSETVDYEEGSIYTLPGAIGSGVTENDRKRLDATAQDICRLGLSVEAPILDVGCAQGGLLTALRRYGLTNLMGLDPSRDCVQQTRVSGHSCIQGALEELPPSMLGRYELVILSHVLEHIQDPVGALRSAWDLLTPGGKVYIEVPDAENYSSVGAPFLDFNAEHINHFSPKTLDYVVEQSGMRLTGMQRKTIELPHKAGYPALWAIAKQPRGSFAQMNLYIEVAEERLKAINRYLEKELEGARRVIIWGVNSYCANIVTLPVFQRVSITQAVDRNPALHGRISCCGVGVVYPDEIRHNDIPIVITTLMAINSIRADIEARGLPNRVISIPDEVYS